MPPTGGIVENGLEAAAQILEVGGGRPERVRFHGRVRIVVIGGKIRTGSLAGAPIETGAETFLVREQGTDSAVLDLARRVGLGNDLVHPEPVAAAIALNGGLHKIPGGTLLG